MRTSVVLTTIYPREQTSIPLIEEKCKAYGWDLVVVGDRKTSDMVLSHGVYLSPESQLDLPFKLSKNLPWNCYERKNIGYLYALKILGADYIISTDDDNYPLDNWQTILKHFNASSCPVALFSSRPPFANPLPFFSDSKDKIWARGVPLGHINSGFVGENDFKINVNVVSSLWNGSPDFDALGHIYFDHIDWKFKEHLVLCKTRTCLAPYNTQNTAFTAGACKFQFLPHGIGRANDIWASYISQFVMKKDESDVLFVSPTVYQKRNYHDYRQDFLEEKKVLLETETLVDLLSAVSTKTSLGDYYFNLCNSIKSIMPENFLPLIEDWLFDANC